MAGAVGSLGLGLGLVAPAPARANGRFPASNEVVQAPSDPKFLGVRVTFGLLISRDGGGAFDWVCERAVGFSGTEDPAYVVLPSGAIVAGVFDGLRVSRDQGCSWDTIATKEHGFVDLTALADGTVYALTSVYKRAGDAGSSFYESHVLVSTDDARTFTPVGPPLDETLLAESIEVAPSDGQRIYVSAVRGEAVPRAGVLLVSNDRGKSWVDRPVRLVARERAPFIAAVDAKSPDRVFLRTAAGPDQGTRLLVSDDAGKHFHVPYAAPGAMLGFALAPDGRSVHVGGPEAGLVVVPDLSKDLGPDAGPAAGAEQRSKIEVQCLAHDGDAVLACSNERSGFILGKSKDGGRTFEALSHLRDIRGPLACAPTTAVGRECGREWDKLRAELGLGPSTGPGDAGAVAPASSHPPAPPTGIENEGAGGAWRWLVAAVAIVVVALLVGRALRR